MRNQKELTDYILQKTKQLGALFTEVLASKGEYSLKRVADGEAYQPTAGRGILDSISMSCVIDGKRISANCDSSADIDREMENMFLKARHLSKEEAEPFAPEEAFPKADQPEELLYDRETAEMDDSRLVDAICLVNSVVEEAGFIFDGAIAQSVSELIFANSKGTFQECRSTGAQLTIFGFDPKDRSVSSCRMVAGKGLSQFPVEELARDVANKLAIQRDYLKKHGGRRIDPFGGKTGPQRLNVIMEPSCWAGLLAIFSGQAEAWNGKAYHEGTSFFSGKLGSRVMGENITILDDPLHPAGIPRAFDYEGYPKKRLMLVEKGIAKNVVYDSLLAKKHGVVSTGHALPPPSRNMGAFPSHLVIEGGDSTVEEMIAASKEPTLWITTLHYIRATHQQDGRMTGTTLHGVFLVENGEVVGPTEHLRFDESVPEALSRVTHISKSLPSLSMETDDTPFIVPAMRVEGFRFVSVADRDTK